MIGPGAGVRGRNSPAFAESYSIAERVTRIERGREETGWGAHLPLAPSY